jgi:DAK2 domain fusion protein YloV
VTRLYVDGPTVIRAVRAAVANLEAHVEEVDALNVFPVPDGDTGSNMLATMRAALAEAERLPEAQRDLMSVADALSRGALHGARGNSGVILSQIIRGMTAGADGRRANGLDLAAGLRRGSEVAYGAVLTPVEGTILTVIRDAADAAEAAAGRQPHVEAVLAEVIGAAASSVQRTPMLLPVLEDAGVVDSGGQGLYRLLEGTLKVGVASTLERELVPAVQQDLEPASEPGMAAPSERGRGEPAHHHAEASHGYETEYLIHAIDQDIDIDALRAAISDMGDSVVVAGDDRLARVHVHGERPDRPIAAGLAWGRLSQFVIRDLDDQAHDVAGGSGPARTEPDGSHPTPASAAPSRAAPPRTVIAVASADGLARVLASLGARVVRPAHGSRPSVGELAAAILASGSREVIMLPNDRDALLAARHAAELTPLVDVAIIPSRNAAEGIAAAVVLDPEARLAEVSARMSAEAAALRSFCLTTAVRDSVVDGQPVRRGQVIALDADRRIIASGDGVEGVLLEALSRFGHFELVTCYHGARIGVEDLEGLRTAINEAGWGAELEFVPGGQRHEHLLVAVE